jgi:phosphatidylglycerol:prolipoprotein diacylglycerol transferase
MAYFTFPAIDPVAFTLGPVAIRWYGLAYVAGFLCAWAVLRILDERWGIGLGPEKRMIAVLAAVVGVIVGGRLGYVVVYGVGNYFADPLRIFALWDGGMSFHGGLVGILLAGAWFCRRYKVPYLTICDVGAVGAPVGLFFGRIANFINGELWGRTTDVSWGVVGFPGAGPGARHPSQLYEAGLEGLVIFVVVAVLARKRRSDGLLVGWMLTLYGVFRIFVEFFREPDSQLGFLAGVFTMGQLLSVPMIVAGVWLIVRAARAGALARIESSGR